MKVILSGEGSDEMFAGYPKHVVERHLGRLAGPGLLSVAGHALLAATSLGSRSGPEVENRLKSNERRAGSMSE